MSGARPTGPSAPAATAAPSPRILAALLGIFLGAMMAGMNNRVGVLALADVRGALGIGADDASWLSTAYTAGELLAMPFAPWFAVTLSLRRFHRWMVGASALLALLMPLVHDLHLLLALRFLQGVSCGTLIPMLMMAALKFLPPQIRLHGLALYAMTATLMPNLSIWLAGQWTDSLFDWRWVYWQIVPLAGVAALLVGWGLPNEPILTARFRQANWGGMALGAAALALIAVALDQGVRLDWFHSPIVTAASAAGMALLLAYLLTEWYHPAPFLKLQILERRNLGMGFTLMVFLLIVMLSGSVLPSTYLAQVQGYRPLQTAPIGLLVALPQLVLGSAVAMLLYRSWVDARAVFALGLAVIALACLLGSQLTSEWNPDQFFAAQLLQACGQPMALVSMLFLATSVVQAPEGPYISGTVNTLRASGSLIGGAVIGQLIAVRGRFHAEVLLDHAARADATLSPLGPVELAGIIGQQSLVLSVADAYRVLGVLALALVPLVLCLTYIPAPGAAPAPGPSTTSP